MATSVRVEQIEPSGGRLELGRRAQRGQHRFKRPFDLGEPAAAGNGQHSLFVGQLLALGQVDLGDLEQFDFGIGRRLVRPPRHQQVGNQAETEPVGAAEDRRDRLQRLRVAPGAERFGRRLVDHAERQRLVEPHRGQHAADLRHHAVFGPTRRGDHRNADVLGYSVVAVDSRDLFDQVDFSRQIASPTRRNYFDVLVICLGLDAAQVGQDLTDLVGGDVDAEHPGNLTQPQGDRFARRHLGPDVDHALAQLAAGQFEDQLATTPAGPIDAFGIDPSLEPVGGIAVQVEASGGVSDGDGLELGRLDEDIGRSVGDFGRRAAHHAADGNRRLAVRDDAHPRLESIGLMVNRLDRLARLGLANDDLGALELGEVERVKWLATLHQDVVRDVDDVVDRRDTDRFQAPSHPLGTRTDLHAPDHASRVAKA